MERICHRGRVPAVCNADRVQVIPCDPCCPGQAHLAPFSQGLSTGQELAPVGSAGWHRLPSLPMEPQPGEPRGCTRAVWVVRLPAQHGVCREPWQCWLCTGSGALPGCPGKGRCCSRLSPLQRGEFLVSLVPCELPGAREAAPVSCLPAVACGTAAEQGTTNARRVVVPLQ